MKRIEIPNSDVIGNIVERTSIEIGLQLFTPANTAQLYQFVRAGIAFANEVIEASANGVCELCDGGGELTGGFCPRCKGTGKESVSKWTPKPGDKCAFWLEVDNRITHTAPFEIARNGFYYDSITALYGVDADAWTGCALLESLDEIGKPPWYFIDRGRCTVEKGGS